MSWKTHAFALFVAACLLGSLVGCAAPGTRPLPPRDQTRCEPLKGPDSKIRYRDTVYQQYRCPGYGYLSIEIVKPEACRHDS